jgi:uncharacterized radical SAM protein YgiQ
MFLPISLAEARQRGWHELDVIFVTGDAYIDHPAFGVPLLARFLEARGFRVGIIAQPDWRQSEAFTVLGRPRLFFAVSAGAMDSMVAHYTPARKLRHDDAYTPGNRHGARPNRATIVYTSGLKAAFRDVPVVIGGIEASLRRFAHYDFWENKVRRSLLFDAKADLLVYGMGERPLLEVAERLRKGEAMSALTSVRGTAYISRDGFEPRQGVEISPFEVVAHDRGKYAEAFRLISREQHAGSARPLLQRHGERLLVSNPPALPLATPELDAIYALPFVRAPHPSYQEPIPAYEQIKTSITTHRGCCGGCSFCAITHHQGRTIQSRSKASILREARQFTQETWFHGAISDLGGPTANMYGLGCENPEAESCRRESCLYPRPCKHLRKSAAEAVHLLREVRRTPGVRHVAISSGVRYDLLPWQQEYFRELFGFHVGGLLKVAPEHLVERVTALMRKPGRQEFERFLALFREESGRLGKRQHLVPYLMSGHPGCTLGDMVEVALLLKKHHLRVEQVQDFTPTPGTLSTCMYYTGIDPFSGKPVHVAESDREKRLQKALLLAHIPEQRSFVLQALRACGREDAARELLGAAKAGAGDVAGCGGKHRDLSTCSAGRGASQKKSLGRRR